MSDKQVLVAPRFNVPGNDPSARAERRMEPLPATVMKRAHQEKLQLCDALEELADSLPGQVDRLRCIGIASTLVPLLRRVHQYEEKIIYPAYEAAFGSGAGSTSAGLRVEHLEDQCFADEVTEALMAIGHGQAIENAEVVGFMLRGLFETMRRHVALESEHILPLISRRSLPCHPGTTAAGPSDCGEVR